VQAVRALGARAAADGLRLFVFGSFARGDARPTSDLDLGVESAREGTDVTGAVRRLRDAVEDLPTVRPIDLVDFRDVTPAFRDQARRRIVPLPETWNPD